MQNAIATLRRKPVAKQQPVSPVPGRTIKIAEDVPPALKKRIENGFFNVFVDWSKGLRAGFPNPLSVHRLHFLENHGRVLFLKYRFKDALGTEHNYLTLKGGGAPKEHAIRNWYTPIPTTGISEDFEDWGLVRREDALKDWAISEKLAKRGVKTSKPIAIIELGEVKDENGKPVAVEKLEEFGFSNEEKPVLYIRAMPQVMRLGDLLENPESLAAIVKWGRKKFGWKSTEDYFIWVSRNAGENLAKMHNAGFVHNYYSTHNITVDGRTVDFDGTIEAKGEGTRGRDVLWGEDVLSQVGQKYAQLVKTRERPRERTQWREDGFARCLLIEFLEAYEATRKKSGSLKVS